MYGRSSIGVPLITPTDTADTEPLSTRLADLIWRCFSAQLTASATKATYAPVTEAGASAATSAEAHHSQLNPILAERLHIDDATQAAANQSADFVGTATDFATYGFTVGAFGGGTRSIEYWR